MPRSSPLGYDRRSERTGGGTVKRVASAFLGAVLLSGATAHAHHSFAATYFEDQTMTIEGDVAQFLFRNPHSFVTLESKDPKTGEMLRWGVEWGGGGQLGRQGITRDSIKIGQHVIIVGNPGRTPEDHRLRMVNITRPSDGWKWGGTFD